ncbi:hypothetical protein LINPERPRIM_LOCUS22745 [Linum perenne]
MVFSSSPRSFEFSRNSRREVAPISSFLGFRLIFSAGSLWTLPSGDSVLKVERDTFIRSPEFLYRLDSILILASNSPICIFLSAGLPAPPSGDSPVKGYDINQLLHEAQFRWLKPVEVFFILQNHEMYKIIQEPA